MQFFNDLSTNSFKTQNVQWIANENFLIKSAINYLRLNNIIFEILFTLTIHISIDSIDKIYALEINSNVTKGYYARFSKVFKYRKSFYTQLSLDYITSFLQKTN